MVLVIEPLLKLGLTRSISQPAAAPEMFIAGQGLFGEKNDFHTGAVCE